MSGVCGHQAQEIPFSALLPGSQSMPSDGRRTDQPHVLISSFWSLLERLLLHCELGMVAATRQARPAVRVAPLQLLSGEDSLSLG